MKITNNAEAFSARETIMATWEEGSYRRFALQGRTDVISTQIVDNKIVLFPDRSSAHKALAVALGEAE